MSGRFVVWLALGLVAAIGVGPAVGQRRDVAARPKGSSKALKQVAPAAGPRRDLKGEQQRLQQTQKQLKDEREKAAQARRREGSVLAELEQVARRLADKQREVAQLDARIRRTQDEVTAMQRRHRQARRAPRPSGGAPGPPAPGDLQGPGPGWNACPFFCPVRIRSHAPMAVRHLTSLAVLDARVIQEYRETSEELAERKGRSKERERELTDLRGEARREQADVDREAARRRVLLAKVRDERAYHERMVGDLTEASQRLEAFIRELQAKQRQAAKVAPPKAPPPGGAPRREQWRLRPSGVGSPGRPWGGSRPRSAPRCILGSGPVRSATVLI